MKFVFSEYTVELKRSLYLMVGLLLLSAAAGAIYYEREYSKLKRAEERVRSYHLASATLLDHMNADIITIELARVDAKDVAPHMSVPPDRPLSDIHMRVQEVVRLQREFGHNAFDALVARLAERERQLGTAWRERATTGGGAFSEALEAMAITTAQLDRLHSVYHEEALDELSAAYAAHDRNMIGVGLGLVLLTLFLLRGYTRTINRIATEKARADKALAQFKTTLDATSDCVFIAQPDTMQFTYANQAAMDHVGYSKEELYRMTPLDISAEFDEEKLRRMTRPLVDGTLPSHTLETVHRHKNGVEIPVEITLTYIAPEGEERRLVAIARDISERKAAEEYLKDNAATMAQAQALGRMGHYVLDIETGIAVASEETYRIVGLSPDSGPISLEQVVGELVVPEDRERVANDVQKALSTGMPFDNTHRIRRMNDGAERWVHMVGEVIINPTTGKPKRMVGIIQDIHEVQMLEQAFRDSEATHAKAQAIAHVGHWDWDIQTGGLTWSDEVFRIAGREPGSVAPTYDLFLSILHPEDSAYVQEEVRAAVAGERPYDTYHRMVRPDGEARIVREIGDVERDPDSGEPVRMIGTVHDVTEQKQAEEALRTLNEQLELRVAERTMELMAEKERAENYLAIAGTMIVALDREGWVVMINRKGCETLCGQESAIIGQDWFETFLPEEQRESVSTMFRDVVLGAIHPVERFENEVVTLTGDRRLIAWTNVLIRDDDGKVTGTLSSGEDITEKRASEQLIHSLYQRNEQILAAAGDGIYGVDMDGNTTFVNPAAAHMLGWKPEELIGGSQHKLTHHSRADGSDYPREECPIYAALHDGQVHRVDDEVFWRKDGTAFPVEYSSTPIREGEEITGAVVTFRDITARKRAEAELRHAQRMESLGSLAGGISHSLNNLLMPISALSRMAVDELEPGSEAHECLKKISQASDRAQNLATRILSFSRKDEPEPRHIQVHEVIENALELVRSAVPSSIHLDSKLDPKAGTLFADPTQIESAFMNLISNSVDALEGKPGKISVRLTGENGNSGAFNGSGGAIRLTVSDTGKGLDETTLERALDPFFTTKEVGKGTGLGLSVTHGIVTRYNGKLDIDSIPGKGTTINILLPRADVSPPAIKRH